MNARVDLATYLDPLVHEYIAYRKWSCQLSRATAAGFNLVGIWQPSEVALSRIIATLLDPRGPHGQGKTYLQIFLHTLRDTLSNELSADDARGGVVSLLQETNFVIDRAAVGTERIIYGARRIDVLVTLPYHVGDRFLFLGIENKPWASEQDAQLADYADGLESLAMGARRSDWLIIYLTADARKPSTASEKHRDRIFSCSYPGLLGSWVEQCCRSTDPDKLRHFLRDFRAWIEYSFPRNQVEDGK